MALLSAGVRLAPEVPLWCGDCAEVALEPRGRGRAKEGDRERERERLKGRGCVMFLFLDSPCKHETSSR